MSSSVIWITGASRGIGAALAHRLASGSISSIANPARVVVSGRSLPALERLASDVLSKHPEHSITPLICVVCDVGSRASVDAAWTAIAEQCGGVDVLVNNAGVGLFTPLAKMNHDEFDHTLDVNLRGAWYCTKAVLPSMLERKAGVIVNMNSVAAVTTFTGATAYAASKAGLLAMSRSLRQEVRSQGIRVIDALVGATETDIWDEASRAKFAERMMQPDDVAEAIAALLALPLRSMPEELILRPQLGDL